MQRTSSSPLSVGNAAWQPNSCYSFEEFNGESSGGKIICMDYIACLHHSLIPLKGTISNGLITASAQSPAKPWNEEQSPSQHAAGGSRQGLLVTTEAFFGVGWREEEALGEENCCLVPRGATQREALRFTSIPADFQWWKELVPLKNLLKNRQLTLFFKIKFKIMGLFLTDPYSSLLNDRESQHLQAWHGNYHTNFWPNFREMQEMIGFDHCFWPVTLISFIRLKNLADLKTLTDLYVI